MTSDLTEEEMRQALFGAPALPLKDLGIRMKKLISYTTPLAITLYLMSFAVTLIVGLLASATGSYVVLVLGVLAALSMWWPLLRDLVPVAWSVSIHGRWPARNI